MLASSQRWKSARTRSVSVSSTFSRLAMEWTQPRGSRTMRSRDSSEISPRAAMRLYWDDVPTDFDESTIVE